MKVYVVGNALGYLRFLDNVENVSKMEDADIVMFTGGEDVDPSMYNCDKRHPLTYSNIQRDIREKEIFEKVSDNQLVVGVCRGSQFLCAMNGGILVQDVRGHAIGRTHPITNGKEIYEITSTHHQMQYPFVLPENEYDVLYWANNIGFSHTGYLIDAELIIEKGEPEIVYYHRPGKPKCLAIQGHPEMMPGTPVTKMLNKLIKELCN